MEQTDPALVRRSMAEIREYLRSALASDALDAFGYSGRSMNPAIRPVSHGTVLVGRAFTVSVERATQRGNPPYLGLLAALDALSTDDIFVVSSGGSPDVALWGELVSNAARARGAAGAICDGYTRDTLAVRELGFPLFSRGAVPLDIDGRLEVVGFGETVDIGGVGVAAGELIVADDDGIIVIPADVEADVLEATRSKSLAEDGFRDAVRAGMLPSEAFAVHKAL